MSHKIGAVTVPENRRCTAIVRHGINAGERCSKPANVGIEKCRSHGGTLPGNVKKSALAKLERESAVRGVRAIEADHPEARGDTALEFELRRTVGWIHYCEDRIADLGGPATSNSREADLASVLGGLGLVARETVSGVERGEVTEMTTERFASGIGVWEEKLRWNRAHLVGLTKQWIAAGFEAKRLELAMRTLDVLELAIDGIVRDLGHNPRDADVRRIVHDRLQQAINPPVRTPVLA